MDNEKSISLIIKQLKKQEISSTEIPEEIKNNKQIVNVERKIGLRIVCERGFDIIRNNFIVVEYLNAKKDVYDTRVQKIISTFKTFEKYYDFLDGDIYNNACYKFYSFPEDVVEEYKLDLKKLYETKSFITISEEDEDNALKEKYRENDSYKAGERTYKQCCLWLKKFNACNTGEELLHVVLNYKKSLLSEKVDESFFLFNYIFYDINNKIRFNAVMQFISTGIYPSRVITRGVCCIYNPDDVLQAYSCSEGSKSTRYKRNKEIKDFINEIKQGNLRFLTSAYFDEITHFYCCETKILLKGQPSVSFTGYKRFFYNFEEFVEFRQGDLRNTDLSAAYNLTIDIKKYITDHTTLLPTHGMLEITKYINKLYDGKEFIIFESWEDQYGRNIYNKTHNFIFFFDFVDYLKGDFTDADLVLCDGLDNLDPCENIDFTGAIMQSRHCEKFGVPYEKYKFTQNALTSFVEIENNEKETALALKEKRELSDVINSLELSSVDINYNWNCQRISYISDLHLMLKITRAKCKSEQDINYVLTGIVEQIVQEESDLIFIVGDVSSDFRIYKMFVSELKCRLNETTRVVFILGNHDLWDFSGYELSGIVDEYREFLNSQGMYLLQNDLLVLRNSGPAFSRKLITIYKYDDLKKMSNDKLQEILRDTRLCALGGIGFSGCNSEFNADNGIYRDVIDRKKEIEESNKFQSLYNQLLPILASRNSLVITHMPLKDWASNSNYTSGPVYLNGHTHRNYCYDDGEIRIYADNQIGYYAENIQLKNLILDDEYDYFMHYKDGIHEITVQDYREFNKGKNIYCEFNRNVSVLYMIKRDGYYCFIYKTKAGSLSILNGGASRSLPMHDIQYFFDNMPIMIKKIETPFTEYYKFQKILSTNIKRIGGSGIIHGCIVDIDFNNHLFVNPIDMKVSAYWASNMEYKLVYKNFSSLLKENCPLLYDNLNKAIESNNGNSLVMFQPSEESEYPQEYLNKDMYRASREIKRMQKLSSNILAAWYDELIQQTKKIE